MRTLHELKRAVRSTIVHVDLKRGGDEGEEPSVRGHRRPRRVTRRLGDALGRAGSPGSRTQERSRTNMATLSGCRPEPGRFPRLRTRRTDRRRRSPRTAANGRTQPTRALRPRRGRRPALTFRRSVVGPAGLRSTHEGVELRIRERHEAPVPESAGRTVKAAPSSSEWPNWSVPTSNRARWRRRRRRRTRAGGHRSNRSGSWRC